MKSPCCKIGVAYLNTKLKEYVPQSILASDFVAAHKPQWGGFVNYNEVVDCDLFASPRQHVSCGFACRREDKTDWVQKAVKRLSRPNLPHVCLWRELMSHKIKSEQNHTCMSDFSCLSLSLSFLSEFIDLMVPAMMLVFSPLTEPSGSNVLTSSAKLQNMTKA